MKILPPVGSLSLRRSHILSALAGLAMLQASVSQAQLLLPSLITTDKGTVPINTAVYIERTTAPEWVYFSGNLDLVTQVIGLTDSGTVDSTIVVSGARISGIGLTSGLKYQISGALGTRRKVEVPGSTVVQPRFTVIVPRPIRATLRPVTVTLPTVITFDSNGKVLQASAPPSGQAAWWQAESTAQDALGVNDGQLSVSEAVGFVPGIVGEAFHFAGQGFVEVPTSPTLEPTTVTLAAWVRADSAPGTFAPIVSKGAFACEGGSYALYTGLGGGVQFYVSDGITFALSPAAAPTVWDGDWHLVVGSFDGTTVRLYVDGAEVGSGNPTSIVINYSGVSNPNFYIGAYRGTCELRFNGEVDEVQVFGRALFPAEVSGLFNNSP
jgi:hypothetical protein